MRKKILVVDDEQELLGLMERALTSEGFEVITVTTAEDAMDTARRVIPDLILVDIILPDMHGPEAVRALSDDPATSKIPVIFLSGIITRETDGKSAPDVLVGNRHYKAISKPFTAAELLEMVRKVLK